MKRFLIAFVCASTSLYGSAILVTNPAMLNTTDVVNWSQLSSNVGQTFFAVSTDNEFLNGYLSSGSGAIVKTCTTCTFKPETDIPANDALLLTGQNATVNTSPVYGLGAYLQEATLNGDTGTQFTARIQAFDGVTSVLDTTVTSDASGDAIFLGVSDTTADITRVIFSLTDANGNPTGGSFILDKLYLQDSVQVQQDPVIVLTALPEPGVMYMVGSGLLLLLFGMRKRLIRA